MRGMTDCYPRVDSSCFRVPRGYLISSPSLSTNPCIPIPIPPCCLLEIMSNEENIEENISALSPDKLLGAFRTHYRRYEHLVREATSNPTDSTVLARLGDELDEYLALVIQV